MTPQEKEKSALRSIILLILLAVVRAFLNEIFIYPNHFAPAGLGGIATMIQYVFRFKVGYFSLLINLPLIAYGSKSLNRTFAFRSLIYVLCFSGANIVFQDMNLTDIAFVAKDGGEAVMAAMAAGLIGGLDFTIANRLGGSTGGNDVVAALVHKKNPEYDLTTINFAINASVSLASFFVYGKTYAPVILCIIYSFVNSKISGKILNGAKEAIQFEIFTDHPQEMAQDLMRELKHGCTCLKTEGMYSHKKSNLLICVVNKHQIADCQSIVARYEGSFAVITTVNSTLGNFKKIR